MSKGVDAQLSLADEQIDRVEGSEREDDDEGALERERK